MSSPAPTPADAAATRTFGGWLRDMPRWKKIAVIAAVGALVTGTVLTLTHAGASTPTGPGSSGLSGLSTNLAGGTPGSSTPGNPATEEPAAKGVFRLGFSFLAGFCIGSFVRATLRIAAIAFGFWLTMTVVLSYYGLVTVDWQAMESLWNSFSTNIENEWGSFQRFMTGSLPAAGLAITGLAFGLKRH